MTKPVENDNGRPTIMGRMLSPFTETFGLSRAAALASFALVLVGLAGAVFWVFYSAPPKTLVITAGPPGSSFMAYAERYQTNIAKLSRNQLRLKIIPSEGSLENLQRLNDPKFRVDVGFVQGGVTNAVVNGVTYCPTNSKVESLGSISYQPLLVFYRGEGGLNLVSQLKGRRLAIGPVGSGTRSLAMAVLELNGINGQSGTTLLDLDGAAAAAGLTNGTVDAAFLMGDSASPQLMKALLLMPDIHILDFSQAEGYTRKVPYLNRLEFPMGSIDFGKNIPAQDVHLIGPTVEILARPDLHPALVDLLLEASKAADGNPSLMRRKNEFPAALEHDFPISEEAGRYYKSGKSFLYRKLPFRWASLVNRILVAFVPMLVLVIPALRAIPAIFKLRVRLALYRRYRALLSLERGLAELPPGEQRIELLARLDNIESSMNKMKVPVSFAEQFYNLRGHIGSVRNRLVAADAPPH